MGRVFKVLLWMVAGFVTLFVIAAAALYLFFDPNDFREEISRSVKSQTGRDLTIEGDISLDIFPWFAVEVGKTSLGDAPGFGAEPIVSFDRASFSVRLLPLILQQQVEVGTASIESLRLNLKVDAHGASNWSDLVPGKAGSAPDATTESGAGIDVNSIEIVDASVRYTDESTGDVIVVDGANLSIGRIHTDGSAVPLKVTLNFNVQPAGISGQMTVTTTLGFNAASGVAEFDDVLVDGTVAGIASIPTRLALRTDKIEIATNEYRITMQPLDLTMLDMHIVANVQAFSYEDSITPRATIAVDAFSPRTLMQLFDVEPPETADPMALTRVVIGATAELTASAIELSDLSIKLDDTTFTGTLSVPSSSSGFYHFDLTGDSIDLARYMEPADEASSDVTNAAVPIEIPVDLIKAFNARGKLQLSSATLGNIAFQKISLGLNTNNGKMRLFPISAELFGGTYKGDVQIDVSGATPTLSLNEIIEGVDLASLAKAMFDQDNVTGGIDGSFSLTGGGADMAAIQRSLAGNISLLLKDGTYEGTDVWYELRRARALFKGTEPPEPSLPAKTEFSTVRMTGVVRDGIMRSDDLFAELPFMQLTGAGQVDIPAGTVNYNVTARIIERPEFLRDATPEELEEFTEAVIPLKITGPIASPSIQPDLEKLLQDRVEEEIKDLLRDKLKDLFNK